MLENMSGNIMLALHIMQKITLYSSLLNKCDIVHVLLFKGCALKCNNWPVNIWMSLQSNKNRRIFLNSKKKCFRAYLHIFGQEESWRTTFHKSCILRDNLYLNISFQLKCFSIFIRNTWRGERVLRFRYFSSRCLWSLFVTDVGNLRHLTSYFFWVILSISKILLRSRWS